MEGGYKKKLSRKLSKYKNVLKAELGIEYFDTPTENLMLCNVGLVTGHGTEEIVMEFQRFGEIREVKLFPGKSYSFISFLSQSSAIQCYEETNGIKTLQKMNGPLYLLYVPMVPAVECSIKFNEKPPGLILIENYVTPEEEAGLMRCVDISKISGSSLKHRFVKHYGYEFFYQTSNIKKDEPLTVGIPDECNVIDERLVKYNVDPALCVKPDQLTVNYYNPGQGIPPHIDTHSAFVDPIFSLSLGSDVVMDFKSEEGEHLSLNLPQRSLLIMSGESRFSWTHGIAPRKFDVIPNTEGFLIVKERYPRISLTFRRVRKGDCNCPYPRFCDSQLKKELVISEGEAAKIEKTHVHQVYDEISAHFSETRYKPWPKILEFMKSLTIGSIILDVGCGNGKYFGHSNGVFEFGGDASPNLAQICQQRGFQTLILNSLFLPLKDECVDAVISIAVIHHLATPARRSQAVKEMARVLRKGGKGLIYTWAKNQRKENPTAYLKNNYKEELSGVSKLHNVDGRLLPVHTNRTNFQHHDILVPWITNKKLEKDAFLRFYHLFEEMELKRLCQSVGLYVIESYYDEGNWCCSFIKPYCSETI